MKMRGKTTKGIINTFQYKKLHKSTISNTTDLTKKYIPILTSNLTSNKI